MNIKDIKPNPLMNIKDIKPNPNNPRLIKDDKFKKLVQSIKEFPKMIKLDPSLEIKQNGKSYIKAME